MNKLKDFTRKYGFYLAVGVVSVSAVAGVFLLSNNTREVDNQTGAFVQESTEPTEDAEAVLPNLTIGDDAVVEEGQVAQNGEVAEQAALPSNEVAKEEVANADDEVATETFSSTTADPNEKPYFAEGDTMLWPVEGKLVVPYRDDTTKHWYSTALEQTMRTYGICIGAKDGEAIKAPAKGVIVDIIDDSTKLDSMKLVGNVGQVIIIDHGNGYKSEIGVQGGKVDKDLVGQTVDAAEVIGTAGKGVGPFADLGSNVYLQVKHNDKVVDPTTILGYHEDVAGVDMGHDAD